MSERLSAYIERRQLCRRTVKLLASHGHLPESFLEALNADTEWSRVDKLNSSGNPGEHTHTTGSAPAPSSGAAQIPRGGNPGPDMVMEGHNPMTYFRFGSKGVYHHRSCHQFKRSDVSIPRRLTVCSCLEIKSSEERILVDARGRLYQDQHCDTYQPLYDRSNIERFDFVTHYSACMHWECSIEELSSKVTELCRVSYEPEWNVRRMPFPSQSWGGLTGDTCLQYHLRCRLSCILQLLIPLLHTVSFQQRNVFLPFCLYLGDVLRHLWRDHFGCIERFLQRCVRG